MKAYLVGLWLSMSVSLWCVIEVYLDYPGPVSFVFMFIIIVPGLIGLYFSTKIKTIGFYIYRIEMKLGKTKWMTKNERIVSWLMTIHVRGSLVCDRGVYKIINS